MPYSQTVQLGYNTEANFVDFTTQNPAGLSIPTQVKYGNPIVSTDGILSVDAAGTFTILKLGDLLAKTRLYAGRSGASGFSTLVFWVEFRLNNTLPWSKLGNSVVVKLDNSNERAVFFDFAPVGLPVGAQLRSMMARDGSGDNSGGLLPFTPDATLTADGVLPVPSAQLTFYDYKGIIYS